MNQKTETTPQNNCSIPKENAARKEQQNQYSTPQNRTTGKPMNKTKTQNTMNCIKTNLHYQKAVQTACRKCFETACDREHFSARMDGIAHFIREISDTPQSDENFIDGIAWALLNIYRWSE